MKWLDNIDSVLKNKDSGICPFCKSNNTDYRIIQITENLGHGDIWCNECKKAIHLSRVHISDDIIKESKLPESLEY